MSCFRCVVIVVSFDWHHSLFQGFKLLHPPLHSFPFSSLARRVVATQAFPVLLLWANIIFLLRFGVLLSESHMIVGSVSPA